jgi:hypothetical protein
LLLLLFGNAMIISFCVGVIAYASRWWRGWGTDTCWSARQLLSR